MVKNFINLSQFTIVIGYGDKSHVYLPSKEPVQITEEWDYIEDGIPIVRMNPIYNINPLPPDGLLLVVDAFLAERLVEMGYKEVYTPDFHCAEMDKGRITTMGLRRY